MNTFIYHETCHTVMLSLISTVPVVLESFVVELIKAVLWIRNFCLDLYLE